MEKAFVKRSITLETAETLVDAAIAKAGELGVRVVVSVLDEAGTLKAFARMDGASLISVGVVDTKAYTALFGVPSHEFFDSIKNDPALLAGVPHIPRVTSFPGGLPIFDGAALIGAIGVSGASPEQDIDCAEAALRAIA